MRLRLFLLFLNSVVCTNGPHASHAVNRLSGGWPSFQTSCLSSRQASPAQMACQLVCKVGRTQPIKRAWFLWPKSVNNSLLDAIFASWRISSLRSRQLRETVETIDARKATSLVVDTWITWRRTAGAAKTGRLLHAWTVTGSLRRALWIMRMMAREVRAATQRRRRLLRCGVPKFFDSSCGIAPQSTVSRFDYVSNPSIVDNAVYETNAMTTRRKRFGLNGGRTAI